MTDISKKNEYQKQWRIKNAIKVKEYRKKHYDNSKPSSAQIEKRKKNKKKWYLIHKKQANKTMRNVRLKLTNGYVSSILTKQNLPITPELIETKRIIIEINRLIKQKL